MQLSSHLRVLGKGAGVGNLGGVDPRCLFKRQHVGQLQAGGARQQPHVAPAVPGSLRGLAGLQRVGVRGHVVVAVRQVAREAHRHHSGVGLFTGHALVPRAALHRSAAQQRFLNDDVAFYGGSAVVVQQLE